MKAETFVKYAAIYKQEDGELAKFYNQAFHPDLIQDLFENCFFLVKGMYRIGQIDWVEIKLNKQVYSPMSKMDFPFGTLDQFIGDCHRFNVELVWKKEIINKYFLQ